MTPGLHTSGTWVQLYWQQYLLSAGSKILCWWHTYISEWAKPAGFITTGSKENTFFCIQWNAIKVKGKVKVRTELKQEFKGERKLVPRML